MPAPYTGGCQCGSLRYVLDAEPIWLVACHCKGCQRQSGSAFGMSMLVKEASLTVTGPTKRFTRTTDSGNENTGVFCPECGVRIYHIPGYAKDVLVLKPGTLDDTTREQAHSLLLQNAVYVRSARESGDLAQAAVLENFGRVLTTLDNEPPTPHSTWRLRLEMNTSGLLLDIRILRQNDDHSQGVSQ